MMTLLTRVLLLSALALPLWAQQTPDPNRWEPTIQAFEKENAAAPHGAIVFYGSSSIRRWDLPQYFPGLVAINRGFGGSTMADALRYIERAVLALEPKTVVLYEGDNDLGQGRSPQRILSEYQAITAKIHKALPKTRIVLIAIKPSLSRWKLIDQIRKTNAMFRSVAEKDPRLKFVDVDKPMIGADGEPRPELFVEDGLHLSHDGNLLWAKLLRPLLE